MSKKIKQMEMDALKKTFQGVTDLVVLSPSGVDSITDNHLRQSLRKKNIRMQVVKNSLARRVFEELGVKTTKYWEGVTLLAWGAGSLGELSREVETSVVKDAKLKAKIKIKGAVSEGLEVTFDQALKMPTKAEAVGRILGLVLSPMSRIVSQLKAPGANLASQIKTLIEKGEVEKKEVASPASA